MNNRAIKKSLSIVLVIAIVISAVCGSVISINAATASKNYSIVGDAVAAGTKTTTMTVTLNGTNLQSGKFDLMFGSDVIDDVNFNTTLDENGNVVAYNGYKDPVNETLEEFLGTRQETNEVTSEYDWNKVDTSTDTQWATTDPDGNDSEWQSTGNTRQQDNYVAVSGSTKWDIKDPDEDGPVWELIPGKSRVGATPTETTTVRLAPSEVPADTDTVKYVLIEGTKEDNWTPTGNTKRANYNASGIIDDNGSTRWVWNGDINDWTESGVTTNKTTTVGWFDSEPQNDNSYYWKKTKDNLFEDTWTQYYKSYLYSEQRNDPTYNYDKRVYPTEYEYQEHENKPYTETEYAKHLITYYEWAGGRDKDGNNMITAVNVYKTVDVYDENGNKIGDKQVIDTDATKKKWENSGNKGTLLPNVYDKNNGLWNTKIEITGGTKTDGTVVSAEDINSYFTNGNYNTFAKGEGNTENAVAGSTKIDGVDYKYVYNMTDNYYTTHKSNVTYVDTIYPQIDADGNQLRDENGNPLWKQAPVINDEMLKRYYREYTTVDVATPNLEYAISTVSEDTVGQTYEHSQYAQGFKNITFNASEAFSSITFTVTLDFNGTCDRVVANDGVDSEELENTINNVGYKYGSADGRWATENYVGYGKKYQLNLLNASGDIANIDPVGTNVGTDFIHVHTGTISEKVGTAAPLNQAAIDALLAKNPSAVEGEDYFKLYNSTCYICNRVTPMLATYDMPYKITDENGAGVSNVGAGAYSFNSYRNISGVNLEYKYDGSVSLNIHYPQSMDGEQMIITDENGIALKYSDTIASGHAGATSVDDRESKYTAVDSFYKSSKVYDEENDKYLDAKWQGLLLSSTKMITVDGFSASEADQKLYIARYTPKSDTETQLMGITHSISLVDYCNAVINDDRVYYLSEDNYSESNSYHDKMVAAAFINYAHASKTALSTPNDYKAFDKTEAWAVDESLNEQWDEYNLLDGKLADKGEKGDSWENAIIIDTAEEFAYLSKKGGNDTAGKYYKVADGIKYFDMSGTGIDLSKSLQENLATLQTGYNFSGEQPGFQGYFDGNGVTVYGIYNPGTYTGLFSWTKGDVIIKNVNVTMSYFKAVTNAGGIVGFHEKTADTTLGSLAIENCSVTNCYIETTGTSSGNGSGAILGREINSYEDSTWKNGRFTINNCYVNLDADYFKSANTDSNSAVHGGLVANANTNVDCDTKGANITNCVVIGVAPYATTAVNSNFTNVQHSGLSSRFSNVYTDQPTGKIDIGSKNDYSSNDFTGKIFHIEKEAMTGDAAKTNMPALDWYQTWRATDDYPELYTPYNRPKNVEKTIYWDEKATIATGFAEGSGTKDDPYIINTVAELAYLVKDFENDQEVDTADKKAASSYNKHFKVADGIKNIVLQPETYAADIMALGDAQTVKTYFETNAASMKKWVNEGWEKGAFCGTFDGNGATVYGLYQNANLNAGLFTTIDAGATIKNIGVKNSYMKSAETWNANWNEGQGRYDTYQVGAIAAVTSGKPYGQMQDGVILIDGCTVANNYMENDIVYSDTVHQRNGVIMGAASDAIYVENCFTYGNKAVYGNFRGVTAAGNNDIAVACNDVFEMSYLAVGGNNASQNDATQVPEGVKVVVSGTDDAGNSLYVNMIRNSLFLDTAPYNTNFGAQSRFNSNICCEDVYSVAANGTVTFSNGDTRKYTPAQLTQISVDEIKGLSAKSVMNKLDWYDAKANPDGAWHCSYLSDVPSLEPIGESIADLYPAYNIEFTEADADVNQNSIPHENGTMKFGVYTTALSLYANPYLSFVFAFHGDYKNTRDQVKIKFVYTENGESKETGEISPPACEYDADGNVKDLSWVNNWANVKASGRYHTYKADDIPVEALANGITVMMSHPSVANGEYVNYGTYSAKGIGYAFDQLNTEESPSEYYAACTEATRALVFYAEAIELRYGTI